MAYTPNHVFRQDAQLYDSPYLYINAIILIRYINMKTNKKSSYIFEDGTVCFNPLFVNTRQWNIKVSSKAYIFYPHLNSNAIQFESNLIFDYLTKFSSHCAHICCNQCSLLSFIFHERKCNEFCFFFESLYGFKAENILLASRWPNRKRTSITKTISSNFCANCRCSFKVSIQFLIKSRANIEETFSHLGNNI